MKWINDEYSLKSPRLFHYPDCIESTGTQRNNYENDAVISRNQGSHNVSRCRHLAIILLLQKRERLEFSLLYPSKFLIDIQHCIAWNDIAQPIYLITELRLNSKGSIFLRKLEHHLILKCRRRSKGARLLPKVPNSPLAEVVVEWEPNAWLQRLCKHRDRIRPGPNIRRALEFWGRKGRDRLMPA